MAPTAPSVPVPRVYAVRDGLFALVCILPTGDRVAVPRHHIALDSAVRRAGDVGVLRIRRECACAFEVIAGQGPP